MTIKEFHYDFKLKIDKVDSLQHENFIPAEIDWMLNEAISIIVKQRFGVNNSQKQGFESNEKRIQDLKTLHIKSPTIVQPAVIPTLISTDFYEVKLSDLTFDFLFLTRGTARALKTNCGSKIVSLKEVQNDDFNDISTDPFWKPSFEWRECPINFGRSDITADSKGSIYIYTDNFTLDEVYIEYIKAPNRVSLGGYTYIDGTLATTVECDLPSELHKEIVDIAVSECARIISDPNFLQIKQQKLLVQE